MSRTTLDLFCGAGGFSLGMERAGFDVAMGVDVDEDALATYAYNHDARAIQQDLAEMPPSEFTETYDLPVGYVDGVVGGPPCQGFSLANHGRFVDDERNNLVFVFEAYAAFYDPDFALMENVGGIETIDDGALFDELLDAFREDFAYVDHATLNAADYGVPQTRKRVFVQARNDEPCSWPEPTHAPREEVDTDEREERVVADD